MKVYLIRHAQVGSNFKKIVYNQKDEDLTKEGGKQAEKIAKQLSQFSIDKIYISGSKRAYQTILPLLRLKTISIKKDKRLNDCEYGIFGNLTSEEAKAKYPEIFKKRQKDKWNIPIPRGESFKDVAVRLNSFFNDLKKEAKKFHFENIVIVTHATNLKVFLVRYLKFSTKKADAVLFKNASISLFELEDNKIKVESINDSTHLDEAPFKNKRVYKR